jgi:RNA polymerase sigma-70 factor (ECF subfamily)
MPVVGDDGAGEAEKNMVIKERERVASWGIADPADEALRLFEAHGTPLYRFCRFTLGRADEAEDVVQETFLKLLQHLGGDGDRSNLRAWLFAVAANGCRDRARWRARWVPWRAEFEVPAIEASPDTTARRGALAALRALAPRDRLLLGLRLHGLSYRDISQAAGIAEASVGRLLARALARWKQAVEFKKS